MPRTQSITDNEILDAATNLIGRDGVEALTFSSLSIHTNLAPSTLVQRFRTKETLLFRVAEHCTTDTEVVFVKARAQKSSPLDAILKAFGSLATAVQSAEHFANGLTILQLALKDPQLRILLRDNMNKTRMQVQQLLDDAVAAGEITSCDTTALASCLQTTFEGATVTWSIYQQGTVVEWTIQQLEQAIKPYRTIK